MRYGEAVGMGRREGRELLPPEDVRGAAVDAEEADRRPGIRKTAVAIV